MRLHDSLRILLTKEESAPSYELPPRRAVRPRMAAGTAGRLPRRVAGGVGPGVFRHRSNAPNCGASTRRVCRARRGGTHCHGVVLRSSSQVSAVRSFPKLRCGSSPSCHRRLPSTYAEHLAGCYDEAAARPCEHRLGRSPTRNDPVLWGTHNKDKHESARR